MKITILLLIILSSLNLYGSETINMPAVSFDIASTNADQKLNDVLLNNPENILNRFKPTGAKISQMIVQHNQFQFIANKTVFFITKTLEVKGTFAIHESQECPNKADLGFVTEMDLNGSDPLVTDNIERYEALICAKKISDNNLHINVFPKLYKGNNYNSILGKIMSDMFASQTTPLIQAISEAVNAE